MHNCLKISFFLCILFWVGCYSNAKKDTIEFAWDNSLVLPGDSGRAHPGVAGAFSGLIGEELVVAGGANFPDARPWEGGVKTWWNRIYVKNVNDSKGSWRLLPDTLPSRNAYGLSIPLSGGLLCIGGCREDQCFKEVFALRLEGDSVRIDTGWPSLPMPLANMAGARIGHTIYMAGGQERMDQQEATCHFLSFDLHAPEKGWQELSPWDGPARGYAVATSQSDGKDTCFYLFSGRDYRADGSLTVLTDGHKYNPRLGNWERLEGTFPVMAANAIPVGDRQILFLGGVPCILPGSDEHPGFDNTLRIYHTDTKELTNCGVAPYPLAVTAPVVQQDDTTFYLVSGEVKPGIRTDLILRGSIVAR